MRVPTDKRPCENEKHRQKFDDGITYYLVHHRHMYHGHVKTQKKETGGSKTSKIDEKYTFDSNSGNEKTKSSKRMGGTHTKGNQGQVKVHPLLRDEQRVPFSRGSSASDEK